MAADLHPLKPTPTGSHAVSCLDAAASVVCTKSSAASRGQGVVQALQSVTEQAAAAASAGLVSFTRIVFGSLPDGPNEESCLLFEQVSTLHVEARGTWRHFFETVHFQEACALRVASKNSTCGLPSRRTAHPKHETFTSACEVVLLTHGALRHDLWLDTCCARDVKSR